MGFIIINEDLCILFYRDLINDIIIMVDIYVDNIVITLNCDKAKDKIKMQLSQEYQMKDLGKVKKIIEWKITQGTKTKTLMIEQK